MRAHLQMNGFQLKLLSKLVRSKSQADDLKTAFSFKYIDGLNPTYPSLNWYLYDIKSDSTVILKIGYGIRKTTVIIEK